jgi:hypothetical protein
MHINLLGTKEIDMSQISAEHTVNAPIAEVWAALADFGGVHRFHPAVERSPIINGQRTGLGAQRTCYFYDGNSLTEEISRFQKGKAIVVDIIEGSMPLTNARRVTSVEAIAPNETKVTVKMDYQPKFGPLGVLMNAFLIRPKFHSMVQQMLAGLAQHVETGAIIGENGVVRMPAVMSYA